MNRMIDIKYVLILIFQIACTNTYAQVKSYVPAKKHIVRTEYVTREIIDTLEAERIFNEMRPALIENNHTDITSWDQWLLGEDEIPYKEITDTIITEMDATENDVWNYIESLDLVSDKTKDAAFIAPTLMLTNKTWLLKRSHQNFRIWFEDEYGLLHAFHEHDITGKLHFNINGKFIIERIVEPFIWSSGEEVPSGTIWKVTYNGSWVRHKKEYICMKPNVTSVRVLCIKYQGTPYQQLSERMKSNVNDEIIESIKRIKEKMLTQQTTLRYLYGGYPNTKDRSLCERLDEYFLVLGKHIYVNKDKFYEVYEKSIK